MMILIASLIFSQAEPQCELAYPDICVDVSYRLQEIDLSCDDIDYENFQVVAVNPDDPDDPRNDPHGFDKDADGVGCEAN